MKTGTEGKFLWLCSPVPQTGLWTEGQWWGQSSAAREEERRQTTSNINIFTCPLLLQGELATEIDSPKPQILNMPCHSYFKYVLAVLRLTLLKRFTVHNSCLWKQSAVFTDSRYFQNPFIPFLYKIT